jgi:hypothetical protein
MKIAISDPGVEGWLALAVLTVLTILSVAARQPWLSRDDLLNLYMHFRHMLQRRAFSSAVDKSDTRHADSDPFGPLFDTVDTLRFRYNASLKEGTVVSEELLTGNQMVVSGPTVANLGNLLIRFCLSAKLVQDEELRPFFADSSLTQQAIREHRLVSIVKDGRLTALKRFVDRHHIRMMKDKKFRIRFQTIAHCHQLFMQRQVTVCNYSGVLAQLLSLEIERLENEDHKKAGGHENEE